MLLDFAEITRKLKFYNHCANVGCHSENLLKIAQKITKKVINSFSSSVDELDETEVIAISTEYTRHSARPSKDRKSATFQ